MAQAFNLELIQKNLAKAKAEAEFWELASAVLSDPRIASVANGSSNGSAESKPVKGELRDKVCGVLPDYGRPGLPITAIVRKLEDEGYVFAAKHHGVSVNDALRILEKEGLAVKAGKKGLAILWTKGKSKEPANAGS
jgi:hypothetical protein